MDKKNVPLKAKGLATIKGHISRTLGEKMITYDADDRQECLIDVRLSGHNGNCAMVKLIKPKSHCSNNEKQRKLNDSG
jgi:hypothetical protein